jgi:hypothetical protein
VALGNFNHHVQLPATDLVIVLHTQMGFRHAAGYGCEISRLQRFCATKDAFILADHMMAAPVNQVWQIGAARLKLLKVHVAQSFDGREEALQYLYAFFALRAPLIVFSAGVRVLDHGIAYHHLMAGRQRQPLVFQRAAVQQYGVTGASETRGKLVHDADPGADEFILCALA